MSENSKPHLFSIGGAHMDRRGFCDGPHQDQTSNPGTFMEEPGGGVFNAARMVRNFGPTVTLANVRGGDATAKAIEQEILERGIIDLPIIHLSRATPSYTAILDHQGELITALADMQLYKKGLERHMRHKTTHQAANKADAILFDSNASAETCADIAALGANKPTFAMAISPAKVLHLKDSLSLIDCLFMNRREAKALVPDAATSTELCHQLRDLGLKGAVITDGSNPLIAFKGAEQTEITPTPMDKIVDVTGAGDAFAGAYIANHLLGKDWATCLNWGMKASRYTIGQTSTAPYFSPSEHQD